MKFSPRAAAKVTQAAEREVQKAILARAPLWGVVLRRQNTGAMRNATGRLVRFGEAGAPDLVGMTGPSWGPLSGKVVAIEVKREGWKPPRPPKPGEPPSDKRRHWERQLARLREINANHGYGFWTDDIDHADQVINLLKQGYKISIGEDEHPWLVPPTKGEGG